MDKKSYIKEHSWSGFKSGVKYSSYLYLGATIASLLISLAVAPIFPFTLLISNPIAWAMLGVAFVGLSAAAVSVAKPLFHWAKDSINQKKVERQEGKGREKVVDGNEKQSEPVLNTSVETESPDSINQRKTEKLEGTGRGKVVVANKKQSEPALNIETKSPRSLLSNVDVDRQKLLLRSNNLISETFKGHYQHWLSTDEIDHIVEEKYGKDNGVMFPGVVSVYALHEEVPKSSEEIRERVKGLNGYFDWFKEEIEETGGLNRPIFSLILGLQDHWVTLVIDYDSTSERFRAYYCNSFGGVYNSIDEELLKCLEEWEFFPLRKKDIRINKTKQQENSCDCGIYALENAEIIIDMMKQGRSFNEIDGKLAGYVHTNEEQEKSRVQEKRKEFAGVLMDKISRISDVKEFEQAVDSYTYKPPIDNKETPKAMCR